MAARRRGRAAERGALPRAAAGRPPGVAAGWSGRAAGRGGRTWCLPARPFGIPCRLPGDCWAPRPHGAAAAVCCAAPGMALAACGAAGRMAWRLAAARSRLPAAPHARLAGAGVGRLPAATTVALAGACEREYVKSGWNSVARAGLNWHLTYQGLGQSNAQNSEPVEAPAKTGSKHKPSCRRAPSRARSQLLGSWNGCDGRGRWRRACQQAGQGDSCCRGMALLHGTASSACHGCWLVFVTARFQESTHDIVLRAGQACCSQRVTPRDHPSEVVKRSLHCSPLVIQRAPLSTFAASQPG